MQIHTNSSSMTRRGGEIILGYVKTLPQTSGVYRMIDDSGIVLYIGKARNLKKRVSSYLRIDRLTVRLQRMVARTASLEFITTRSEVEALLLEAHLIKRLQPRFNVLLRDDKTFPQIVLTLSHLFPRISKHRGGARRSDTAQYYGPFTSSKQVADTIIALQKAFLLRNCADSVFAHRTRPCLQYQIKRCTAPCTKQVTETDYAQQVEQVQHFLAGGSRTIQEHFVQKMQAASHVHDFETAAGYRDRLRALSKIQVHQDINLEDLGDVDIVAAVQERGSTCIQVLFFRAGCNCGHRAYFPRHDKSLTLEEVLGAFLVQFYDNKPIPPSVLLSHVPQDHELIRQGLSQRTSKTLRLIIPKKGKKRRLIDSALLNAHEALRQRLTKTDSQARYMAELQDIFKLPRCPERIEVFDNSHLQGSLPVAAMIVADAQGFVKTAYRKFHLKDSFIAGDDCAMMQEVIRRRFTRAVTTPQRRHAWPDLVILDGGRGQLNAALKILDALNITDIVLVAMAKGLDRYAGHERFFLRHTRPFSLDDTHQSLLYLQSLRNEAHRFALKSHRERRIKAFEVSPLDRSPEGGSRRLRNFF